MSKLFGALAVILLVAGPAAGAADNSIKIGVVNFQEALNGVEQGKTAKANLKSEFDARQKRLDLQQEDLKKMRDELEKKRLVLSPTDLQNKEEAFNKKYLELQKNFADYRQEIVQKEGVFTAAIIKNLKELCAEIGKQDGYALIVESSQDAVLFASAKEDLTSRLIKLYNQRYKGPLTK